MIPLMVALKAALMVALTEVLRADEKVVLKAALMVVSMAALVVTLRALLMFLGFLYVPWLHLQSWLHPDLQWLHPNLSAAGLILTHQCLHYMVHPSLC